MSTGIILAGNFVTISKTIKVQVWRDLAFIIMEEIKVELTEYEQPTQEKLRVLKNKINEIIEWINKN